jgi:hypothetical protein
MPISSAHGWGRDVFSLALAIQMLLWGAAQPFVGAIADRFGPTLVLSAGAILKDPRKNEPVRHHVSEPSGTDRANDVEEADKLIGRGNKPASELRSLIQRLKAYFL